MKIFILGTAGAGKTVLLAMLSRHVATKGTDLILEPMDNSSRLYIDNALSVLDSGEWPGSTLEGKPKISRWRFGGRKTSRHEIELVDAAGQDLRKIFLEEEVEKLTKDQQEIRACIDGADILIYMLDLDGFLRSKDYASSNENAWIYTKFLTNPKWKTKRRLVVLSKADLYFAEMVHGRKVAPRDVKKLIKRYLPKNHSMGHLVDEEKDVSYKAIISVKVTTVIDKKDGAPHRVPKVPLEAVGMDDLLLELKKACNTQLELKKARNTQRSRDSHDSNLGGGVIIGGIIGGIIGVIFGGIIGGIFGGIFGGIIGGIIDTHKMDH